MRPALKSRVIEGSCWPCRRRRVKCDLLRPVCTKCQVNRAECDYGAAAPIRWVGGAALRGRDAPARLPKDPGEAFQPKTSNFPPLAPPISSPLDTESLLLYFENAVLPRFQMVQETLQLDLRAVMHDRPLQQAISAVARTHYHMFSHATSNDSLLCRRRDRHLAIQILRRRLELGPSAGTSAEGLFPVAVLLCMLDGMIEPSEQSNASMCHLKGGYALIYGNGNLPANMLSQKGLQAHLLSVFATMDLVHAILSGDTPYFNPFIWYMFADIHVWFGRLDLENRFLALLKVLSEMASLAHTVASRLPSHDGYQLVQKCIPSIESSILSQSRCSTATPSSEISLRQWGLFCDLYELSAIIYMHRALRGAHIDDDIVQSATTKGVEKLINGRLSGMTAHCVIFPILVIGAHTMNIHHRSAILRAISASKDYLSFGNLQVMLDLLQSLWSDHPQDIQEDWWNCFKPLSGRVFLF